MLALFYALALYASARAILHQLGEKSRVVAAGVAVLISIAVPYAIGRVTHHLGAALAITVVLALASVALLWRRRPRHPITERVPLRVGWPWIAIGLIELAAVSSTAIFGYYFDEDWVHYALSGGLARGVFPMEHPLLPGEPFLYHYGFDLLVAEIMVLTDLPIDRAIDAVRIGGFVLLLFAAARLGHVLAGKIGAGIAIVLLPLGGSPLTYLLFRGMGSLQLTASWVPGDWVSRLAPPVITNYFQPPQGLGMPMAIVALLLLHACFETRDRRARLLLLAFFLGAIATVQIVFFVLLGFGAAAALAFHHLRAREGRRAAILDLLALATGPIVAIALGGFFERSAGGSMLVFGKSFFDEPIGRRLLHYLFLGGLPLLSLAVPFIKRTPLRIGYASAAIAGILIFDRVTYARSWDSIKFLTVAFFLTNVAAVDAFALFRKRWLVPMLILSSTTGALWLSRTTIFDGKLGMHRWVETPPPPIALAFYDRFDDQIPPYDRILAADVRLAKLGFHTPGFTWKDAGLEAHLVDRAASESGPALRARALTTLDPEALDALGICWIALSKPIDRDDLERIDEVSAGRDRLILFRRKKCSAR